MKSRKGLSNFLRTGSASILVLSFAGAITQSLAGETVPANNKTVELSQNPVVRKQESETLARLKKAKKEEQAELLYQLGTFCFDNRDYVRAEIYMRDALSKQLSIDNPEELTKTHIALALILGCNKKIQESFSEFEKALELSRKAGLKEYESSIVDSLGSLALRSNQLDQADKYYKQAFELGQASKNIAVQMNALVNQATVLRQRKQMKEAVLILQKALKLADTEDADRSLGLALVNLARVQHDLGNLDDSIFAYKKAIEVFKQDLDFDSQANACWGLAETLFGLSRTDLAHRYYKEGLEAIKDEPANELKISLLVGLGSAEADLGHFDNAQKFHKEAYDLAVSLKNRPKEMEAILQMGNDFLLNGYPEAGLHRLLDAERLLAEGGLEARNKGTFYIAIGRCYKSLGQFDLAKKYYEEAMSLFESISDMQSRVLALNSLAVLALDSDNKADFDVYYKEAKSAYDNLDDKRDLAILDYNYAQYLVASGRYSEAVALYGQALANIRGTSDKVSEGKVLRGIGLAELLAEHPQQALPYYEKALALADEFGEIEGQWDCHHGLGKAYKKLGLNDMAVLHLSKAVDLVEKERGHSTSDSFKTYNLDLRNDCFVELVDLYVRLGRSYDALAIAEKGRARAFLDMLSSRKGGRRIENFEAPISSRARPAGDQRQLVAMAKTEDGTRGVSVIPRASQIYASSAVSPSNAKAPDIDEIKTLVKNSKSTVLQYFILPEKIVVWTIDPDSTIHMLPPIPISKQRLAEKVALTYEAITHQPKNQQEVEALKKRRHDMLREMHTLLIKPVEAYLPKSEESVITIIPHGPMFMIPFAALIDEENKFFVEKHTIAYMPAIGVMRTTQKLEETLQAEPDKLLAFGNPITKAIAFLGALPFSEKEVQNIANLFGAEKSLVKVGESANKKTFEELAPQFSEIHLATHGLVDEENPMQSSLVLAPSKGDDGLLSVKDILAMKELRAKLVVLSACQTGRGKITGDGVVGLSRAFIIAGTPAVLVSQWNVDDIITEYQMRSFYKGYLARIGKSKSVRQAQIDTIKYMEGANYGKGEGGIRANPRYWAAFQLIGEV